MLPPMVYLDAADVKLVLPVVEGSHGSWKQMRVWVDSDEMVGAQWMREIAKGLSL